MTESLGIVVPAYRPDPDRLANYLQALDVSLAPTQRHVELDVPDQDTLDRLKDAPGTVAVSARRRGKGAAITAGFDHLETDVLAFVDADGSTPPASLRAILDALPEEDVALAVGSRRHPESVVPSHQSRIRRRLGDLFVVAARRLLPIKLWDYQCGAKVLSATTWSVVRHKLVASGFAWDIDLLTAIWLSGGTVTEVPIEWEDQSGTTVNTVGTMAEFTRAILRARLRVASRSGSVSRAMSELIPQPTPLVDRHETRSFSDQHDP